METPVMIIIFTTMFSVIGGMIGAYILNKAQVKNNEFINEYLANKEVKKGAEEVRGELFHGRGKPAVIDNIKVWRWTNDLCGKKNGHIIFGPYTHDLSLPGHYKIDFIIKGMGFKPEDNKPIMIIDVVGIVHKHIPLFKKDGTPEIDIDNTVKVKRYTEFFRIYNSRKIEKRELSNGKWNTFSLIVFSSGVNADLYEFRVAPINNYEIKEDEEVYIDKIIIHRVNK